MQKARNCYQAIQLTLRAIGRVDYDAVDDMKADVSGWLICDAERKSLNELFDYALETIAELELEQANEGNDSYLEVIDNNNNNNNNK